MFVSRGKLRRGLHNTGRVKHVANSDRLIFWTTPFLCTADLKSGLQIFCTIKIFQIAKNSKPLVKVKQKSRMKFGVLSTPNEFRNHFQITSFRILRRVPPLLRVTHYCHYLKLFAADPSAPTTPALSSVLESLMACEKGHTMATPNYISRLI